MNVNAESPPTAATPTCGCASPPNASRGKVRLATIGAVLASLGICAASCLLPAVLIGAGVAGSFVAALDSLAPYKWIFIAITAMLLGYGFYTVYWKPRKTCAAGASCETCASGRSVRIALWLGTALAISGIGYGYMEPWLSHQSHQ
jgi:mercuric ion transport protein